jgi:hypothetical protein
VPWYLFPFRLALGSARVFRPVADLLCLVPHSPILARELDRFAKHTLIELKQDTFTTLYFHVCRFQCNVITLTLGIR